jgi:AcrR family transcriptional regulator
LGVKERHEREREATARAILDAARELFVAEGYQNVSIRKIAEKVEYSPAAIYGYFPSKDDIFLALAEEGFRLLFTCDQEAAPGMASLDSLRSGFQRFYEFSKTHPEYFALMFVDRSVPKISRDWNRFGFVRDMRETMAAGIQSLIDAGDFPPGTDANSVFRILMAAVHGVAVMRLCERLSPGEDADALARATIDAVLTGLRAGITNSFHSEPCS